MLDIDHAPDLPTIDLVASGSDVMATEPYDRRSFEERYAELGFGLGTVPRRHQRDDAWWETPAGMLVAVGGVLLLLGLMVGASGP